MICLKTTQTDDNNSKKTTTDIDRWVVDVFFLKTSYSVSIIAIIDEAEQDLKGATSFCVFFLNVNFRTDGFIRSF